MQYWSDYNMGVQGHDPPGVLKQRKAYDVHQTLEVVSHAHPREMVH